MRRSLPQFGGHYSFHHQYSIDIILHGLVTVIVYSLLRSFQALGSINKGPQHSNSLWLPYVSSVPLLLAVGSTIYRWVTSASNPADAARVSSESKTKEGSEKCRPNLQASCGLVHYEDTVMQPFYDWLNRPVSNHPQLFTLFSLASYLTSNSMIGYGKAAAASTIYGLICHTW